MGNPLEWERGSQACGNWFLESGDPVPALLSTIHDTSSQQLPSSVTALRFSFSKEEIKIPTVLCPAHVYQAGCGRVLSAGKLILLRYIVILCGF